MKRWLAVICVVLLALSATSVEYPRLSGFVTDNADMIEPEWEQRITLLAKQVEQNTTAEFAVVTVKSLEGLTIEQYAVELFEKAGIGKKDKDNGILILVAQEERTYRVEVGYGLEPYVTDSLKVAIGRDIIESNFKQGQFGKGIYESIEAMYGLISGNADILSKYSSTYNNNQSAEGGPWDFIIFLVIMFAISKMTGGRIMFLPLFFGGSRSRGGSYGGFGGGGFGGFGGGMSGGGGFGGRW